MLHAPSPQVTQLPQSMGQLVQVSVAMLQVPSPQVTHAPQSPGQLVQSSPAAASHVPSPQPPHSPQSEGQVSQRSSAVHAPSPQRGAGTSKRTSPRTSGAKGTSVGEMPPSIPGVGSPRRLERPHPAPRTAPTRTASVRTGSVASVDGVRGRKIWEEVMEAPAEPRRGAQARCGTLGETGRKRHRSAASVGALRHGPAVETPAKRESPADPGSVTSKCRALISAPASPSTGANRRE